MADTAHLGLPLLEAGQAQKHVTHNDALMRLDTLVQLSLLDRDLTAPPAMPTEGDRYVVAALATGAWAGHDQAVAAWQDGAWAFSAPGAGWVAFAADEATLLYWDGAAWRTLQSAITALQNLSSLGVNTTADATNKLAVRAAAVLHTAIYAASGGSGDAQHKLNKETAGDTASVLLQTNFSGRAEIGLAGDDNLHVKVSPDGASFTEAVIVDRTSGALTLALDLAITEGGTGASSAAAARANLGVAAMIDVQRFTASGTWTKPAAARWVHVIATGGGGGGGGGGKAASGTVVSGGGGGGGGGRVERWLDASALGSSETVTVGAGGAAGAASTVAGPGGDGGSGGFSSLGAGVIAYGGGAGSGGNASLASGGGAGGSQRAAGGAAGGASGGSAGSSGGGAGGGGVNGTSMQTASCGAGGGGCSAVATGGLGGWSFCGGGGGGSGGGVTAGNTFQTGGGANAAISTANGAGGLSDGAAGAAGATQTAIPGIGGGGGAGSQTGNGGAGGTGGAPGGGGGGGGAAHTGNGGAAGAGGRGEVLVVSYF